MDAPARCIISPIMNAKPSFQQEIKWIINLRNGKSFGSSEDAIEYLNKFINEMDTVLFNALECHGSYVNEKVNGAGIPRKPAHWDIDVKLTK